MGNRIKGKRLAIKAISAVNILKQIQNCQKTSL